jgi:hypothetical protein
MRLLLISLLGIQALGWWITAMSAAEYVPVALVLCFIGFVAGHAAWILWQTRKSMVMRSWSAIYLIALIGVDVYVMFVALRLEHTDAVRVFLLIAFMACTVIVGIGNLWAGFNVTRGSRSNDE